MSGPFEIAVWPPKGMSGAVKEKTFQTWEELARFVATVHPQARLAVREKEVQPCH